MADDLLDRVSRPAPGVDGDAVAARGRTRSRRAARAGISLAVIVVLAAAAAILSRPRSDRRAATTAPTTPGARGLLSASTIRDGIELTVTLPEGRVDVGRGEHD